ncbi:polysaccharide biosynthesis protein [Sphingopyxis terrae]|uniref:polysaccharide biosynthesis protein n=1 Tax=Sphingopyxis terrae TaxID=33052 RepID=UPI000AF4CAC2|nr:nucleoside-diphosphate sugar epimerase/dehydratase [Sphingopyxis terrae]
MDAVIVVASAWLSFSIRMGQWSQSERPFLIVVIVALLSWFSVAWAAGIYRAIIRSTGGRTIADIAVACLMLSLLMIGIFMFVGIEGVPRTIGVLQPMILLLLLATSRVFIRYALVDVLHLVHRGRQQRVAIYGAGRAGQQLALALRHEGHLVLNCYIDDDISLAGSRIDGVPVLDGRNAGIFIGEFGIDEILLALPSATRGRRREIVERLQKYPVRVRSLPSIGNIIDGEVSIRDLKEIRVEDLLGRDPVPPDEQLLGGAIAGKNVLVSGAGGSIGSELCRQLLARGPRSLVLVEQSEFALYTILSELEESCVGAGVSLVPELVNAADAAAIRRVMERHRPQTVFHAAAYKHVPLVEANPISGLRNNIMSTLYCCTEAERLGVSRFILVSTDKAVRPTNIMGASKRFCELIVQGRANETQGDTIFSIVRFGNVLSSSGSVVPRFQAQINVGGPVTLTHAEVTRYFMTIPEAAQLVMQAGAMAKGGEVFVLDMGQPVRIIDLARSMIRLSGCTVRDDDNPDGDISIEEIGLRPGEKMYEELLIGENPQPTDHSRIMQAHEELIAWPELKAFIGQLSRELDAGDPKEAMAVVRAVVPDYTPSTSSADDKMIAVTPRTKSGFGTI